jgi:hypothetical protein
VAGQHELPHERRVVASVIKWLARRYPLHQPEAVNQRPWFGLLEQIDRLKQMKVAPVQGPKFRVSSWYQGTGVDAHASWPNSDTAHAGMVSYPARDAAAGPRAMSDPPPGVVVHPKGDETSCSNPDLASYPFAPAP